MLFFQKTHEYFVWSWLRVTLQEELFGLTTETFPAFQQFVGFSSNGNEMTKTPFACLGFSSLFHRIVNIVKTRQIFFFFFFIAPKMPIIYFSLTLLLEDKVPLPKLFRVIMKSRNELEVLILNRLEPFLIHSVSGWSCVCEVLPMIYFMFFLKIWWVTYTADTRLSLISLLAIELERVPKVQTQVAWRLSII